MDYHERSVVCQIIMTSHLLVVEENRELGKSITLPQVTSSGLPHW